MSAAGSIILAIWVAFQGTGPDFWRGVIVGVALGAPFAIVVSFLDWPNLRGWLNVAAEEGDQDEGDGLLVWVAGTFFVVQVVGSLVLRHLPGVEAAAQLGAGRVVHALDQQRRLACRHLRCRSSAVHHVSGV